MAKQRIVRGENPMAPANNAGFINRKAADKAAFLQNLYPDGELLPLSSGQLYLRLETEEGVKLPLFMSIDPKMIVTKRGHVMLSKEVECANNALPFMAEMCEGRLGLQPGESIQFPLEGTGLVAVISRNAVKAADSDAMTIAQSIISKYRKEETEQ